MESDINMPNVKDAFTVTTQGYEFRVAEGTEGGEYGWNGGYKSLNSQ